MTDLNSFKENYNHSKRKALYGDIQGFYYLFSFLYHAVIHARVYHSFKSIVDQILVNYRL